MDWGISLGIIGIALTIYFGITTVNKRTMKTKNKNIGIFKNSKNNEFKDNHFGNKE